MGEGEEGRLGREKSEKKRFVHQQTHNTGTPRTQKKSSEDKGEKKKIWWGLKQVESKTQNKKLFEPGHLTKMQSHFALF